MSPTVVEPKPGVDVGRVIVQADVANYADDLAVQEGRLDPPDARRVTCNALVGNPEHGGEWMLDM